MQPALNQQDFTKDLDYLLSLKQKVARRGAMLDVFHILLKEGYTEAADLVLEMTESE